MTQLWTLVDGTGEVIQACCATADASTSPFDCGEPFEEGFEAIPIPSAPDLHRHIWNGEAWILDPQVARDMRWQQAKDLYTERLNAGFVIPGIGRIQTDRDSREAIIFLAEEARDRIAAGEEWETEFTNEANVDVPVTGAQILGIFAALRAFGGACYSARKAVRPALDQALANGATGEEILAIPIDEGYP